ncbi:hypothetical protein [Polymorphospora rubra]|uniref:Uncharacterized protein n=1 Tax=Polymorphospora rubra TaxID=338584 RepID=A0A810N7S2_9ACTN|nr:hypothetical protein [Polymorphospora rubra]BCJ69070.1 hypothetical protein Prubr_60910 [Polymorphospora rubra]
MTDNWDQWPEDDGFEDGDTANLDDLQGGFAEDGYASEGFGPADDLPGGDTSGEEPAEVPFGAPLGYGDLVDQAPDAEPLDADTGLDEPAPAAESGFGPADAPVGADPDLDPHGDGESWPDSTFPPALDLGAPPEPVDGFPWTDADTLGAGDAAPLPDPGTAYADAPPADDLAAYAGTETPAGGDPWTTLAASDDPATSNLARFWAPGTA